jgi:hypothetical protein
MFSQFFVHLMSLIGTLAKSRSALNLSAFGGRPEVIDTQSEWRIEPSGHSIMRTPNNYSVADLERY